jgi:carbon-monoxide dehydrogenase medium subunit
MKPFDFIVARDSAEAIAALARAGAGARLVAGGTDLLVELKSAERAPALVIDISRASDMKRIAMTDEGLAIGGAVTHTEILDSPLVKEHAPAVAAASRSIGAVQTRNLGTLGGNLANCVPSLDGGPVLVALEAQVAIAGPSGRRRMALEEFFVGPRKTALAPGELLLDILIPRKSLGKPADFQKFGLRKGQALALVNVAASFRAGGAAAAFVEPRIALGAVAPTVMRALQAEAYLEGREISSEAMREAGRIAAAESRPITDFRASAGYRRDLVAVLTRRALESVQARAGRN